MVYINPMREQVENIQRTYPTNHGRVQYTYREHLLLSCPLTVIVSCEVTIRQRQASSKRSLCKVAPTHNPFRASASVMRLQN